MNRINGESKLFCLLGLIFLLCFMERVGAQERSEYLLGSGIHQLNRGRALLFGTYVDCYGEAGMNEAGVLLLVESGMVIELERITAARFLYVGSNRTGLPLIFGDLYLEGPARDPFILLPEDETLKIWKTHTIYSGWAMPVKVFGRDGKLVARLRAFSSSEEGWSEELLELFSKDDGRNWSSEDGAAGVASDSHEFSEIKTDDGNWRIISTENDGFYVEHRSSTGVWAPVKHFAAPAQDCRPATSTLSKRVAVDTDTTVAVTLPMPEGATPPFRHLIIQPPKNGRLTRADGLLSYSPDKGFQGEDAATLYVRDAAEKPWAVWIGFNVGASTEDDER